NQPNLNEITNPKVLQQTKTLISTTVLLETFIFATFHHNPYGYSTGWRDPQ
ncbi:hypothetical protein SEEH8319_08169, partial [Salmonella enterica subsp. enterica serovar Heidelberg str. 579083-19]